MAWFDPVRPVETAERRTLYRRYLWFKAHAGYCVGSCAAGALALARAELWREEMESQGLLCVRWEDDPDSDKWEGCQCGECAGTPPEEVLGCIVEFRSDPDLPWRRAEHVQSLWGIDDPGRNYSRTVEAELCLEVQWEALTAEVGRVLSV